MHLHPQLRALRDDDAPQRAAQAALSAAMRAWREGPHGAALNEELAAFDKCGAVEDYPLLRACFVDGDETAPVLVSGLVAAMANVLAIEPLGHVPMRHYTDGAVSTLLVASAGGTTLSLIAVDGRAHGQRPRPTAVSFADNECFEHVVAGSARGELIEIAPAGADGVQLIATELQLQAGTIMRRRSAVQALSFKSVAGVLVTLRMQRRPAVPQPTREYALADGRLLNQASGKARESRFELAAAVLGRMGRKDAAPLLAAMAQEQGNDSLRWQALRECLGLDTATGFAALCDLACDPADSLSGPAGALRAQLIERYPVLQEAARCPA